MAMTFFFTVYGYGIRHDEFGPFMSSLAFSISKYCACVGLRIVPLLYRLSVGIIVSLSHKYSHMSTRLFHAYWLSVFIMRRFRT